MLYTNYTDAAVAERRRRLGITYLLKGDLRVLRDVVGTAED